MKVALRCQLKNIASFKDGEEREDENAGNRTLHPVCAIEVKRGWLDMGQDSRERNGQGLGTRAQSGRHGSSFPPFLPHYIEVRGGENILSAL